MSEPSLRDLDRCPHGRHLIDPCFGCPGGQSMGNPYLFNGRRIGTSYSGEEIRVDRVRREDNPLALDRDTGVNLAIDDDGSVRLMLIRDIPPELRGSYDGRMTGEERLYPGVLAQMRFPDGQALTDWMDEVRAWWERELVMRPWL